MYDIVKVIKEKRMKKALLWGAALCAVLCALLIFAGCKEPEPEPEPEPVLTKIKFTGIPLTTNDGTTPNPDGVTFMLVIPSNQTQSVYGFAVVGGKLPPNGGGVNVAEIKLDGTAETALYDSAQALVFLMNMMTGTPGNFPDQKSIGGSGTVTVTYAKASDGDAMEMPKNNRMWTNVPFKDPLVLSWSQGVDVPAQQP